MVTLSSGQPLTLHHLGSSSGENPDSRVPSSHTTVPPRWPSTAQPEPCSPGCLLFWISASPSYSRARWKGTLALLQYFQISACHIITSSHETSKWRTTPTNHLWELFVLFCFVFNLSALLLACPLPLWPPVPSISFWPLESHPFDFDIASPFHVGDNRYSPCPGMRWSLS